VPDWEQFAVDLRERPEAIHEEARRRCAGCLAQADQLIDAGAEFIMLVNDAAFNSGPFISPKHFREFVTPYLAQEVEHIKRRGAIAIVHSDGNLMPILEDMLAGGPHMLHSIDPMAGMDIAEVKRLTYGRTALMGNVQCNLLQDGPKAAIRESALYCLEHAAPGGGYVFSTSNTIFPGCRWSTTSTCLRCSGSGMRENGVSSVKCRVSGRGNSFEVTDDVHAQATDAQCLPGNLE